MIKLTKMLLYYSAYVVLLIAFILNLTREMDAAGQQLSEVWGDPHVGLVLDSTESRQAELDAIRSAWQQSDFIDANDSSTFHLVEFKDQARYQGSATDGTDFGALLAETTAAGGDDCQDNALGGLLQMLKNTPRGTTPPTEILLATDAAPQGNRTAYVYMLDRIQRHGSKVTVLLNGWCPEAQIDSTALGFLALASGGIYFETDEENIETDARIAFNLMKAQDTMFGTLGSVEPENPDIFKLQIDDTVQTLGVEDDYYN